MTYKVYSLDEERYFELDDMLSMLEDDGLLVPGTVIYEGDQVQHVPSEMLHGTVDSIVDQLGEAAWEEAGEFAEDWPEIPLDKKVELEKLIGDWLDANVPVTFWTVHNVRKLEMTDEWISENAASPDAGKRQEGAEKP